jgi:hypothetical protein
MQHRVQTCSTGYDLDPKRDQLIEKYLGLQFREVDFSGTRSGNHSLIALALLRMLSYFRRLHIQIRSLTRQGIASEFPQTRCGDPTRRIDHRHLRQQLGIYKDKKGQSDGWIS